jgi:hypothetical protein
MKKIINNAITGETVERDMTAEEVAAHNSTVTVNAEEAQAKADADEQKATNKASAKAKLIAGEALTADEADTIVL